LVLQKFSLGICNRFQSLWTEDSSMRRTACRKYRAK